MRVYRPKRKRLTQRQMLAVWDQGEGRCCLCGSLILGGQPWDAHHLEELRNGGADTVENMRPVHAHCHKTETAAATRLRAKADRVAAKHLGIYRPSRRPMPGSRASKYKIRLDRTIIFRDPR